MDEAFRGPDFDPDDEGEFTPGLVFVIMPFSPDMDELYQAIRDECPKLGLHARRADDRVGSGIILREIAELIENAEFLIVDLTHERPNVYYELGYAHGVGNESIDILLIAQEGTSLHFDIAPLRVRYYKSVADLRETVRRELQEMIRVSRGL
jgi:hypothetical protein